MSVPASPGASDAPSLEGDVVGSYRRFGPIGPAYRVVSLDGPTMVKVVLLETGEELSYPVDEARSDPDIWNSSVAPITDP